MKKDRDLIAYFVLAYAITWVFHLAGLRLAEAAGSGISNESNYLAITGWLTGNAAAPAGQAALVFSLGAGPLLAALIVTAFTKGRAGLAEMGRSLLNWRVGWKGIALAFGLPLGFALLALGVGLVSGQVSLANYQPLLPWSALLPYFVFMFIFTGLWEEPGWRGFALPRLQKYFTAERASWILGPLWALWHAPVNYQFSPVKGPGFISYLLISMVAIVGFTIVFTWLYNNYQGSLFLMVLMHGWYNVVQTYLVTSFGSTMLATVFNLLPWLLAIYLLKRYGSENLGPQPRQMAD